MLENIFIALGAEMSQFGRVCNTRVAQRLTQKVLRQVKCEPLSMSSKLIPREKGRNENKQQTL